MTCEISDWCGTLGAETANIFCIQDEEMDDNTRCRLMRLVPRRHNRFNDWGVAVAEPYRVFLRSPWVVVDLAYCTRHHDVCVMCPDSAAPRCNNCHETSGCCDIRALGRGERFANSSKWHFQEAEDADATRDGWRLFEVYGALGTLGYY